MNQKPSLLLAYKPTIWRTDVGEWVFPHALDWCIPRLNVIETTCSISNAHVPPTPKCICGIYLSLSVNDMWEFSQAYSISKVTEQLPIVGVFQLVGTLYIDGNLVRAGKIFPWGAIVSPKLRKAISTKTWGDKMMETMFFRSSWENGYRLRLYDGFVESQAEIVDTWSKVR